MFKKVMGLIDKLREKEAAQKAASSTSQKNHQEKFFKRRFIFKCRRN